MGDRSNGIMSKRDLSSAKKKKQTTYGSEDEEDSSYGIRITEEQYRAMLGEHIQKYKRRPKNSSTTPSTRIGIPVLKSSSKIRKSEITSDFLNNGGPRKLGNHHEADFAPEYGIDRFSSSLK